MTSQEMTRECGVISIKVPWINVEECDLEQSLLVEPNENEIDSL